MTERVPPSPGSEESARLRSALSGGPEAWDFFVALIESMPVVPYIDIPDDLVTIYVGPQVRRVLGMEPEEVLNPQVDESINWVHPEDRDRALERTAQLMDAGGGSQEWRFIRPDTGEIIWIEERISVVEVDGRRLSPGVLIDITQQKEHEAEIAAYVQALERVNQISKTFTELVVGSGDVTAILDLLAELAGGSVILTDATGNTTARGGTPVASDDAVTLEREVRLRGEGWGRLTVTLDRPIETADEIAVDRATTALALALLLEREAHLLDEVGRAALVNDVVMERITSGRELRRRARALGVDLGRRPLRVVVAEPVALSGRRGRGQARSRQRLREQLERDLVGCGCTALVGSEGDRVVGVAAVRAELVRAELDEAVMQPGARIGVSELVDGDDLLRAYQHAVDAVEHAAHRLPGGGAGAVVHFEDLGLSQLLTRLSDGPELARFVEHELGPLVQHDRTHGANLLATLSAYLAENGSKTAAARRLGVERRTVYYRLDRIGALLGRDLDDPEARLRLDVALRGWEVLQSLREAQ